MLKTRRLGYDGRGQFHLQQPADIETAWQTLGTVPLIYEGFVRFSREVSIIGVRSTQGETRVLSARGEHALRGILRYSVAPYRHAALQKQAETYLKRLLKHFDYAGVLTIEFFVARGRLIANEMAPRVHNSGHWTIEGAQTSQFENHVRAILGLPLGSTRADRPFGDAELHRQHPAAREHSARAGRALSQLRQRAATRIASWGIARSMRPPRPPATGRCGSS